MQDGQDKVIHDSKNDSFFKSIMILILGGFLLKYGADFLVESTKALAEKLGISDRAIAVTIVAIGTSIPELATSIIAAFKKEENLALGNLLGSNIFNVLAVLGITASVKEINIVDAEILSVDYLWMILIESCCLVFLFMYFQNSKFLE